MLGTNSAVVRRTLAGLRDAGFVASEKGHHGGWRIADDLRNISLLDIYRAVGVKQLFAIGGGEEHPECAVEAAVNQALGNVLDEAEQALLARFAEISLEDLKDRFDRHFLWERTKARWPALTATVPKRNSPIKSPERGFLHFRGRYAEKPPSMLRLAPVI